MGKIPEPNTSDALYIELCGARDDLAKSVQVAVTHIKLRAECTAAIAEAAKVDRAAETLRAAATSPEKTAARQKVSLVPNARHLDAVDEIYAACTWLMTAQAPRNAPRVLNGREESVIALRVLELQDRFGGLIKK